MRFTKVLLMPQNMHRLRDAAWQKWRVRKIPDDGLAAKLEKSGIQVVDAMDFVRRDSPLYKDYESLPDVQPILPQPVARDASHPLWKERPAKVLHGSCFPMEGVRQAQQFTKCVQVKAGLPESILAFSRSKMEEQDVLVQNVIQQAYLWDAHLDKLPNLRSLEIPVFHFKNNYGITAENSNELLMRNLLRLCEAQFPMEAGRTVIAGSNEFRLNVEREGFHVQFQLSPKVTILSKHLLQPPFPTISETKGLEVPDISPFNAVLNFEEENIYETDDYIGFKSDSGFPYIHTSCFSHTIPGSFTHVHPRWNSDRFSGCTLLYGFSTAALMARRKYGANVKILPEPITTQTIHYTGKEWQFGVFQLNTLDLDEAEKGSVKNVAWLTSRRSLFEKCGYDYRQGRAVFEGYNPEVFRLLYGFYAASTLEPFPPPPPPSISQDSATNVNQSPSL